MSQPQGESGLELVLDNRKLIIGFVVLMVICAAFFLFGFVEGKRQATRAANEPTPVPFTGASPPSASGTAAPGAESAKALEDRPVREQLDFYKNLNKKATAETKSAPSGTPPKVKTEAAGAPPVALSESTKKTIVPPKKAQPDSAPAPVEKTLYTIQIGAFRDRKEAEKKAEALKAKGYNFAINPVANGLFGIQVGQFESRADAFAIRLRLKKDGFTTLIKTR